MFNDIVFVNSGTLSLIDITTMGDSSKRGDPDKIGKFDSGLKYALCILMRHGIEVSISSGDTLYTFDQSVLKDESSGKEKTVLGVTCTKSVDYTNKNKLEKTRRQTAFAINLGHEWELWMAIREFYANCVDEGGSVNFVLETRPPSDDPDTTIIIHGHELIQPIIDDWDRYFIGKVNPTYESDEVSIYRNHGETLKIYKHGILIYHDDDLKSKYLYDVKHASIDEMRVLNEYGSVCYEIENAICRCDDHAFIKQWLGETDFGGFEGQLSFMNNTMSDSWVGAVNLFYEKHGHIPPTYKSLMQRFMTDNRIDVGARLVAKNEVQYSENQVKVEIIKKEEKEILSFDDKVKKICSSSGFELEYPIVMSGMNGTKALADKYKKVIYVTEAFCEQDVWQIIKAQFKLKYAQDRDAIYKEYAKSIRK